MAQAVSEIPVSVVPEQPPYANVLLDLAPVEFPVKPYVENGVTMVPLRALGEAVGAQIGWDESLNAATYSKDGLALIIKIGKSTVSTSDGQVIPMPQPTVLAGGHTMVPLRLFTEILGYAVRWDEATCTVYISSPETRTRRPLGFYALGSVTYSSHQTSNTLTATMIARLTRWKACSWDGLRWTKAGSSHPGPIPRDSKNPMAGL